MSKTTETIHAEAQNLLVAAQPLFVNHNPEVTRAVLVALSAMWFGSFVDPEKRKAVMAEWSAHILDQVAQIEARLQASRH